MSKKKEVDMQTELFESILPAVNDKTSRYPTLLSIIPLFAAGDRLNHTTDQMNGIVYDLPDGRVRRIGPGLDVFDEDTLIAILQLGAQKKAIGLAKNMQIPVNDKDEVTTVFKGSLTASKINYFLGRKSGGADIEATRDSIRRLANQRLWFETDRAGGQEGVTDFFKYVGSSDLKGEIFVQISPQMVNILQTYQIIDMSIRRQLNDTAKAVYRYLIPQPKKFSISLEGLAEAISCDVKPKELKRRLVGRKPSAKTKGRPNQLKLMVELGFLESAEITGTGRSKPFVLEVVKTFDGQEHVLEKEIATTD